MIKFTPMTQSICLFFFSAHYFGHTVTNFAFFIFSTRDAAGKQVQSKVIASYKGTSSDHPTNKADELLLNAAAAASEANILDRDGRAWTENKCEI